MASGRTERVYHQDYIARIRYSNTLPPPPNPPKLLDIPGTGIASNNYTSASYALKLAREQPLNIEADAELGMPIDLVGLPGVFDGDESGMSIVALCPSTKTQTNSPQLSWRRTLCRRFTPKIEHYSSRCQHSESQPQ
jgi:RNA polymerase II-associated factor 1